MNEYKAVDIDKRIESINIRLEQSSVAGLITDKTFAVFVIDSLSRDARCFILESGHSIHVINIWDVPRIDLIESTQLQLHLRKQKHKD